MIERDKLVGYLDESLQISQWSKVDSSLNGLQVEGNGRVREVAFAVDACEQIFNLCLEAGAQMLIVHHGLFWGKPLCLTGSHRQRVKILLDGGISLYAAHLPLDFHPEIGHNACIARGLGLEIVEPLTWENGLGIGTLARAKSPLRLDQFVGRIDRFLETSSQVLAFGKEVVERVGIIAGDGGKVVDQALSRKIDTFITGETSHTLYHFAREYGLNVVFAGHYATEVPGLKKLAARLEQRFGLTTQLLAAPTGL